MHILPRFFWVALTALLLLVFVVHEHPHMAPVFGEKITLALLAGFAGYVLDVMLHPYARPDGYLKEPWQPLKNVFTFNKANHEVAAGYESVFAAAMQRRAIIVGATIIGIGLGA